MPVILFLVLAIAFSPSVCAAVEGAPEPDWKQINYSLGHQIGSDLKRQGIAVSRDALRQGILDALSETEPRIPSGEMSSILTAVKKRITETEAADSTVPREPAGRGPRRMALKEKYRGEGREFLEANATKEGIVTLPSGLQYQVITEGAGKTPSLSDHVKVRYRGQTLDGKEFDSANGEGQWETFPVKGLIPGWTEALQLMREGSKWRLFVPADLAYGERGPLADRTVIFDIELISVEPGLKAEAAGEGM